MKATQAFLILIILLLVGCATNKGIPNNDISKNRYKADREIAKMNEALAGAPAEGKEIIGSAKDGVVLHKDVIRQGAKPGDYLYRQTGEDRGKLVILTQYDIDTSKAALARMNEELLDEKSGSVRSLLDEIIEEEDLEFSGEPTDETEIPYSELSGRVIEYISDIRDRKQIVLITTKKTEEVFFDKKFPVPPWHKVKKENSPVLITFILTKKVTSTENKIFSFSEDIESTKILLKEVKEAPIFLPPPPKPPKPPKPVSYYDSGFYFDYGPGLGFGSFGGMALSGGFKAGYGSLKTVPLYIVGEFTLMTEISFSVASFLVGPGIIFYPIPLIQLGGSIGYSSTLSDSLGVYGVAWRFSAALDFGPENHGFLLGVDYFGSLAEYGAVNSVGIFMKYAYRHK
ncbi:MAG: hypothetical protein Ta2G_18770 [Termitinemataceae bacterium]|nr:MAG: hypothetical protein Ta2G_18770 [Termitinemataceae bacterium]